MRLFFCPPLKELLPEGEAIHPLVRHFDWALGLQVQDRGHSLVHSVCWLLLYIEITADANLSLPILLTPRIKLYFEDGGLFKSLRSLVSVALLHHRPRSYSALFNPLM